MQPIGDHRRSRKIADAMRCEREPVGDVPGTPVRRHSPLFTLATTETLTGAAPRALIVRDGQTIEPAPAARRACGTPDVPARTAAADERRLAGGRLRRSGAGTACGSGCRR